MKNIFKFIIIIIMFIVITGCDNPFGSSSSSSSSDSSNNDTEQIDNDEETNDEETDDDNGEETDDEETNDEEANDDNGAAIKEWEEDQSIKIGDVRTYEGKNYIALLDHTSSLESGREPSTDENKDFWMEVSDGQTITFTAKHSFSGGQGIRNITRYRVLESDKEEVQSWEIEKDILKTIKFTIDFDYEYELDFDGVGNSEWKIDFQ